MWDMKHSEILYKVIAKKSDTHRNGTCFINGVPDKNA